MFFALSAISCEPPPPAPDGQRKENRAIHIGAAIDLIVALALLFVGIFGEEIGFGPTAQMFVVGFSAGYLLWTAAWLVVILKVKLAPRCFICRNPPPPVEKQERMPSGKTWSGERLQEALRKANFSHFSTLSTEAPSRFSTLSTRAPSRFATRSRVATMRPSRAVSAAPSAGATLRRAVAAAPARTRRPSISSIPTGISVSDILAVEGLFDPTLDGDDLSDS